MQASIPSADIAFSLPLTGGLRACALDTLLTSLAFLLQQTPAPLLELRRWAGALGAAAAAYAAARGGGRPPPPRGLQRRRALAYLARLEALLAGVRAACACAAVHGALLVLGPTVLSPRLAVHIALSPLPGSSGGSGSGDSGGGGGGGGVGVGGGSVERDSGSGSGSWRVPPVRPEAQPRGAAPPAQGDSSDGMEQPQQHPPQPPLPAALPASFAAALPPDLAATAARKVARALITEAPALLSVLDATPRPAPMHVLLCASPLLAPGSAAAPSAAPGASAMPPDWLPRPAFQLKPQRARRGAGRWGRARYALSQITVSGGSGSGGGGGGSGDASGGGGGGAREGADPLLAVGEACWYQWAKPPKGFVGALPRHPVFVPRAPRGGGGSSSSSSSSSSGMEE